MKEKFLNLAPNILVTNLIKYLDENFLLKKLQEIEDKNYSYEVNNNSKVERNKDINLELGLIKVNELISKCFDR